MKKTLTLLAITATTLIVPPACFSQNPYYLSVPSAIAPSIYQPTMITWQSEDVGVPIPTDPGSSSSPPSMNGGVNPAPLQSPPYSTEPIIQSPDLSLPVYPDTTWNAFSPPVMADPFLQRQPVYPGTASPYAPYNPYQPGLPPQGLYGYGANAPQPYRFGWQNRLDVSWLPNASVKGSPGGAAGRQDIFGVDYKLGHGSPFIPGWILNWSGQFGYRNWNGPGGTMSLPNSLYRFGTDIELETPQTGPFSISLGISPSINTDLDSDVWGDGFQLDGRGILFFQLDQYWTLGLGAMYWNRVDDIVIPWAGLMYRDDYWDVQLMFPEARVSVFLGNEAYWSKWAYVRAEYHVEAYGVNRGFAGTFADDQVQIRDYRILLGLKMDGGFYNWVLEGGWVFDREVKFASATPGYDLSTGFIGQIGVRY